MAVEDRRIAPFRLRDRARTGTELDCQRLRLARAMPALIAIPDTVDFKLEALGGAPLNRDFDVQQAKDRIGLHALLIEVDKGYPAVFAFAPACI